MRRVAEVARLLNRERIDAVVALVSPPRPAAPPPGRSSAANASSRFMSRPPWPSASSGTPKGLYQRAARNEQFQLTGVQAPYEPPPHPDLILDTSLIDLPTALANLDDLRIQPLSRQQSNQTFKP